MTYELIKKCIDQWDPIELLEFCPRDEYDILSMSIYMKWSKDDNDLAKTIYDTFYNAFGKDTFNKSYEDCLYIAKLINSN